MTIEERNKRILERMPIIREVCIRVSCAAKRYLAYDFINDVIVHLCREETLLSKPMGYFRKAVRHICIDMLKDKKYCYSWAGRFPHYLVDEWEDCDISSPVDYQNDSDTDVMLEHIRSLLSDRDWLFLTCKERGYTQSQIAELFGYNNRSTISKKRSYLYRAIRKELSKPLAMRTRIPDTGRSMYMKEEKHGKHDR